MGSPFGPRSLPFAFGPTSTADLTLALPDRESPRAALVKLRLDVAKVRSDPEEFLAGLFES